MLRLKNRLLLVASETINKDVRVLFGSSLVSQVVMLAAIPLLTRIYPPDVYAVLAALMAASVIGGLGAPLGLDYAVPVARKHSVALSLAFGGLISTSIIGLGIGIIATTLPEKFIAVLLGTQLSTHYAWLVGIPIALTAMGNILESLQVRRQAFSTIGLVRLIQAIVGLTVQIGLGLMGSAASGLVIGYISMLMVPFCCHSISILRWQGRPEVAWHKLYYRIKSHRHYLQYTAPEAFFNALSVHGPILLIGSSFATMPLTAHLNLGIRLLQSPSFLFAKTGAQMIQGSMHEWQRRGELRERVDIIMQGYVKVGLSLGIIVASVAPFATGFVLGEPWAEAGYAIALLVPSVILYTISYPLISVGYLKGRNLEMLLLTAVSALMRLILCALALPFGYFSALLAFTGGAAAQYALLTMYLLRVVRR